MQNNLKEEDLLKIKELLGIDYSKALFEVLKVRESRMNQYKNTFMQDDFLFLYYQVQNKMKRFSLQLDRINEKEIIKNEKVALDSAIDAANYAIFMVAKILNK